MRFQSYERPLTLFDIVASIFRYKWRFLLVTSLMLILSGIAVMLFPKRYESEAKLFVRLGRGSATVDPTAIGQTISIQESRESEMNSIVDMLKSRGLAELVVDSIGPDRILRRFSWIELQSESLGDKVSEAMEALLPGMGASVVSESEIPEEDIKTLKRREVAIKEFAGDLKIDSPKKSTTISITFRGSSPELAQDVVETVIDCYRKMHIDAYRYGGTLDFFNEQFTEQEQILAKSEEQLRATKNENAMLTMKGKQESLQTEMTDIKKLQLQTQADMEAAQGRMEKLKFDIERLPKELQRERTKGISVGATDAMRDRLYALEIQEKELSSKYFDNHPELLKVREQLTSARDIMDDQPVDREQSTMAVNPVHQQLENEILLAEAALASLESKRASLDALEAELVQRLNKANDLELVAESLQRQIEISRENHRNYARKLEESRINAALDTEAVSNVSVVSQPTRRYKHASPNRVLLAGLGTIFSVLCGVATALVCDYRATSLETKKIRDAERERYLRMLELEAAESQSGARSKREFSPTSLAHDEASAQGDPAGELVVSKAK